VNKTGSETVNQASRTAKQNLQNIASFAIQVLPVTGTADAIARGDYVDASISFVGDVALGLGVVGRVAKGAKAAAALKGAQAVNAIKQAQQMTVRLVAIERSIVVVRFGQSGYAVMQGEDGKAAAYLGEAVLRIFGIKYILKPAKGIDPRVFTEIVDDYVSRLPRINTPTKTPANLYEIKHTGPFNYTISGGGAKFKMDGYRGTTILDTKHVGKPKISPFIPGSDIEDKYRKFILDEVRDELDRIRTIIKSKETPFDSLEIITNTNESKAFFEGLLQEFKIPGTVRISE